MSFFAKKHQAPAYCRASGLVPGYQGYPGDGRVPVPMAMPWPVECVPTCGVQMPDAPGSLLPMPMPGPPCGAAGVHPEGCQANPMVLYGDSHKQELDGEIHDMHIEKELMEANRQKLEEIEVETEKRWGNLEKMLLSKTRDPMQHDHSLVLMIMTSGAKEHCVQTFKDMKLRNPMPHEAYNNRLFRVIKTCPPKDQTTQKEEIADVKEEIADVLYYDFTDNVADVPADAHNSEDENMQQQILGKIKQNDLEYPRELQRHGAEWILIRSSCKDTESMISGMYGTKCWQREFNQSYYTLCRLYEEPMAWEKPQYEDEYIASLPLETGEPKLFDSYELQKEQLRELFYGENSKYKDSYGYSSEAYNLLDIRDYLLKHPDWRAGYHDLMCANVHYGQYKLLERSIFLILFAAYKYKKKQYDEKGQVLSIDDVLKRLTCVYLGGGTPTPGKEDQHFPRLLQLIPHFLLVSYDVHKPDIGGAFDKKHVYEPEYKTSDAQASDDAASTNRNRLLLIQKMCDYNEVQKIRNTMNATAQKTVDEETGEEVQGERFYVVIQDIRTDVSLILCELESYRMVIKRLVYAVRQDDKDSEFLGPEKRAKFIEDIRETLRQKQVLREKMQKLVENDNICQMIFAHVFCQAPNCMAVSAKWTFQYPNSRQDTSMAYCPDGMTIHQSFLGASTEHTAMMTTSIHEPGSSFTYVTPGICTEWGETQEEGRWTNLDVGLIEGGRFITNQYELVVPSSLKIVYRNLCGEIPKNSIDGLVAYLQLKDPREEHIGAGTKFMVLHMYAQMCHDLRTKHADQTPAFLWERMQHAQAQALRKKAHALEHAWYFSRHIDNTLSMPISAEEFENLPDANIETFVREISKYKVSKKMEAQKKQDTDAQHCLDEYAKHLKHGSSIWDFTEEGYVAAITLDLQSQADIKRILSTYRGDVQKRALGQILMRLCDQYHVMTKANIERLPKLKEQLFSVVNDLKYWPGFGIKTTFWKLSEYDKNKGMRTRDVYCNLFLPVVLTAPLRPLMQNLSVNALYNGIKAYLQLDDSGRLLWPMANGKTRKFYDYPSNRSYLELAMIYDIVPLLELIFKKVQNDGNETLVPQTKHECSEILGKEFRKKDDNYTYPLNQAAYFGSENAVNYWVAQCKSHNATDIIPQKYKYGNQRSSALDIARSRLQDVKSSGDQNDHPEDAVRKYNAIINILKPFQDVPARLRRLPKAKTGSRVESVKATGTGGAKKRPTNSAVPSGGASRDFQAPVLKQGANQLAAGVQAPTKQFLSKVPATPASSKEKQKKIVEQLDSATPAGVQAPAKQSRSEVPATPASSKEEQKPSVEQAGTTAASGVQAPTTRLWSEAAAKPTYMDMLEKARVNSGGDTPASQQALNRQKS